MSMFRLDLNGWFCQLLEKIYALPEPPPRKRTKPMEAGGKLGIKPVYGRIVDGIGQQPEDEALVSEQSRSEVSQIDGNAEGRSMDHPIERQPSSTRFRQLKGWLSEVIIGSGPPKSRT
ncbi:hypothetical protein SLS62_007975 [Diatrype stigma]|uniref:Uncharacterized protein n=1 Tax=Diatrype stigma TaxID=117547 RepID=A0AAN9YPU8_9PEZI